MGKRRFTWDTESEWNLRQINHSGPKSTTMLKVSEKNKLFILYIFSVMPVEKSFS